MKFPKHVAIIMDGNGRWAAQRGYPRIYGHIRGSTRVKPIVREADRLGIRALTLYAFSTENWSRPPTELKILWKLLKKYFVKEFDELNQRNIRMRIVGEVERLSPEIREVLDPLLERLSKNTGLQLNLAISYGSRRELSRAAQLFAEDCLTGKHKPHEMSEELMQKYLWTSELGALSDVDLVIRTSGEVRVSNFLLWQSAYAEYVFSSLYWPEFKPEHLRETIDQYSKRERRFGGAACEVEYGEWLEHEGKHAEGDSRV